MYKLFLIKYLKKIDKNNIFVNLSIGYKLCVCLCLFGLCLLLLCIYIFIWYFLVCRNIFFYSFLMVLVFLIVFMVGVCIKLM